jgi:hypothetical protein
MSEEFIKEAKSFRTQAKWCAVLCWIATAIFTYFAYQKIEEWGIVTFGAIIFTVIYFNINKNIRDYEKRT